MVYTHVLNRAGWAVRSPLDWSATEVDSALHSSDHRYHELGSLIDLDIVDDRHAFRLDRSHDLLLQVSGQNLAVLDMLDHALRQRNGDERAQGQHGSPAWHFAPPG